MITIAIDGPAGSGKSTVSKKLAKKLGIDYIDTGAMYRALTLKILNNNVNIYNKDELRHVLDNTEIDFRENHIILDNKVVDDDIRKNEISNNVSNIAKLKEVREKLVEIQRKLANNKSIIMDGRDIGSYVLPNADYKFYLTASIEERGRRRYIELKKKGYSVELDEVINEIRERDHIDTTREFAPLIKSVDAIEIDTTNKSIDDVINEILKIIDKGAL